VRSAFPHGWNNLSSASYNEFKYNLLNQEESILAYRQDYVTSIATLNVKDTAALIENIKKSVKNPKIQTFFTSEKGQSLNMRELVSLFFSLSQNKDTAIAAEARAIGNTLYQAILYPSPESKNTGNIYRIGTFMTYLISDNRKRYFDDSLV
jgi:hypothetical protein